MVHQDIFVTKHAPDGTVLWAVPLGGNDDDEGTSIEIDNAGDAVLAGMFGSLHGFVAKLSQSDGAELWCLEARSPKAAHFWNVAVTPTGTPVVVGSFEGSLKTGTDKTSPREIAATGKEDLFVWKVPQ